MLTVTASSVTDPTRSATASIAITPTAPALANGTYVFQMPGKLGIDYIEGYVTGVLVAKDGSVTGGEQDSIYYGLNTGPSNRIPSGVYPYDQFQQITGGSYATTPDGNLLITIQLSDNTTETLSGTLVSSAQGLIVGFDGAPLSGTLDLQTATSPLAGGYVFSLQGGNDWGTPAEMAGVINVDRPGGISGVGSELDVQSGSDDLYGELSVGASTVSSPDSYGRVNINLQPGSSSTMLPLYLAGYIVDAAHIRLIETGDDSNSTNFQGGLCGTALGQGLNTGQFSAATLTGSSFAFGVAGWDWTSWIQVAGVFTAHADGTLNGTLNWNDQTGTSPQAPLSFTGTYSVDPTGRVTLSNMTDGATFTYATHLYLTGNGDGLMLYIPGTNFQTEYAFLGQAFQQQGAALTASSFSGVYALNAVDDDLSMTGNELGPASARGRVTVSSSNGVNTVEGFIDTGNGAEAYAVSGTLSYVSNGILTGTLTGLNPSASTTSGSFTLYLVDSSQAILIETDDTRLVLGHLVRQQ
jgi:hypothetical protein